MKPAGGIEPHDAAGLVDHLQPPADVHGRGRHHIALLDDRKLGSAAPDVDVEDALAFLVRHFGSARAVGRQHRLHVMAGGGGDEITPLLGHQAGDRLRILPPQRLAGEDDHPGIDVAGLEAGALVGPVDDAGQRAIVDALVAGVGRQRHRRLEHCLARDNVVAAGEVLAVAAQVDAGKDDLRPRRADVYAHRHQGDVVLDPDRIFFQLFVEIDLEMIVVVIGIAVVLMHEIPAKQMVGQRVVRFLVVSVFLIVLFGHSDALAGPVPLPCPAPLSHGPMSKCHNRP